MTIDETSYQQQQHDMYIYIYAFAIYFSRIMSKSASTFLVKEALKEVFLHHMIDIVVEP